MRKLGSHLRCERGEGIVAGVILLAGVLLPLLFLVPLYARIEQGRLAAAQAARDAVRSAVTAPDATGAETAAEQALARARADSGAPLRLDLTGQFARGSVLHAEVSSEVALGSLPLVGRFGAIVVHAHASAPVDLYRSLAPAGTP